MKFSVKAGDLLDAVNKVSATIDKKKDAGTGGILVSVHKTETSSAVFLYSTNITAESTVKLQATVEMAGMTLLDPDQLRAGLQSRNPGDLAEIELVSPSKGKAGSSDKPSRIRVKIGRNVFHLGYDSKGTDIMASRMNAIPFKQAPSYTVKGKDLNEFVRRAQFCIPRENEATQRFAFSGMKLVSTDRGYEAHATDAHACARIVIKGQKGPKEMENILIPDVALPSLAKLVRKEEDVRVIEGARNATGDISKLFFRMGEDTFFGTRLLIGKFPDIGKTIDMHVPDYWFTVNREELCQILGRVTAFDDARLAHLEIYGKTLKISAHNKLNVSDISDEMPITLEAGVPENLDVKVTVNLDYLKNAASTSSKETLRIGIHDYNDKAKFNKGLVVDDVDDAVESRYVIMPVWQ